MYVALQQLGYTPYHGNQLFHNAKHHHSKCFQEGLTTKYETGKSNYGRIEFDKLLGNYDVGNSCYPRYFSSGTLKTNQ